MRPYHHHVYFHPGLTRDDEGQLHVDGHWTLLATPEHMQLTSAHGVTRFVFTPAGLEAYDFLTATPLFAFGAIGFTFRTDHYPSLFAYDYPRMAAEMEPLRRELLRHVMHPARLAHLPALRLIPSPTH
jgi:hypothetical protein